MAIARSPLHRNISGAIGDLIFRNYNGKTVVSLRPVYKNETNTEARRKSRGRFRDATDFASIAMEDPKKKAYYQQKARQLKLPNAYTAAITDFLRKARVKVVTRSSFAAKQGDEIKIKVTKKAYEVKKITAILYNAQGEVLSEQRLTRMYHEKMFTFHEYEGAGHAFFNVDRPSFRPEVAAEAWGEIWSFFGEHLSGNR